MAKFPSSVATPYKLVAPARGPAANTPIFTSLQRFYRRNDEKWNVAINVLLLIICIVAYVLLITLFIDPSFLQIKSFVYTDVGGIKPATAVTLLAAALSTSTLALLTRTVEHYFWLKLKPKHEDVESGLGLGELRDLAYWTISPLARVQYAFYGRSWMLRLTGVLLLGATVLGPVLVSGISQYQEVTVTWTEIPRAEDMIPFQGWIDGSNYPYQSGKSRDVLTQVAATISLANMPAPAEASLCPAGESDCSVKARAAAIQATCESKRIDNTVSPVGLMSGSNNRTFQSSLRPLLKVTLRSNNPNTFINFTTASDFGDYLDNSDPLSNGTFGYIFGAYVPDSSPDFVNIVDCRLSFGTIFVSQDGKSSPSLERASFEEAPYPVYEEPGIRVTHRIYNEAFGQDVSPFSFSGMRGGVSGGSTLANNIVGKSLLGTLGDEAVQPELAARRIEKIWEMATLMAWVRQPMAALETVVTQKKARARYDYEPLVLLFLLAPFAATVFGLVRTGGSVGGKKDVLGYDPVVIAARGPIQGLNIEPEEHGYLPIEREEDIIKGVEKDGEKCWSVTSKVGKK